MIEIPEAVALSGQLTSAFRGKAVADVVVGASPHKFVWFYGDPDSYANLVLGESFSGAHPVGGFVEGEIGNARLLFSEGINLRVHAPDEPRAKKHQLLLEFDDGSALSASGQMYGGVGIFREGTNDNEYYLTARAKPSPLSAEFDWDYFVDLIAEAHPPVSHRKVSAKALLATEQRIPGVGNGVLQDILFHARLHPKRDVGALDDEERSSLFSALKETLARMSQAGGRDTEIDLYGEHGGYRTLMSRHTVGDPCPSCGVPVEKASYMGGSVYLCPGCQRV
jgi:formamidopyrimidine-DNA glycosylase